MQWLQLVEQHQAKLANMLGVWLVEFEAPREAARGEQRLARGRAVAMRLLAGKGLVRDFLQKPFAEPDAGHHERTQIEIPAKRHQDYRGDAHHIRAIAAHSI